MKTKLIATLMLAAGTMFAGPRVFFGVNVGVPLAPAPVVVAPAAVVAAPVTYATPYPGPGYAWVDGYYTYIGGRPLWHAGYWRAPVFAGHAYAGRGFVRGYRR